MGRFVSRDPIGIWGDASNLGNAQNYCANDPVNKTDPLGDLQRRQVDWLADKYVDGWPGIGPASGREVGEAITTIKRRLGELRGRAFSGGADRWSSANDRELQEMVDCARNSSGIGAAGWDGLAGFPGNAYTPQMSYDEVRDAIGTAVQQYSAITGKSIRNELGVGWAFLFAWVARESSFMPSASAYGSTYCEGYGGAGSSAVGLLQFTKTTYNDYVKRGLIPKGAIEGGFLPEEWDEGALSDPATSILAGLFGLSGKPGRNADEKLGNYHGGTDAQDRDYVDSIRRGEEYLKSQLGGDANVMTGESTPGDRGGLIRGLDGETHR